MSLLPSARSALFFLLVAAPAHSQEAQSPEIPGPPEPVKPMDVFELEYASDPRISPDGSRVVYERYSMDVMTDRARSALWIVDHDGSDHRPLVEAGGSPRWSHDGQRLAYLAKQDDKTHVFVRWMDTGQTARITRTQKPPEDLAWSPDGAWVAFTMLVPEQVDALAEIPEPPEGATWAEPAKVIRETLYRADGRGYLDFAHRQVFIVPSTGGTPRQLTSGPFDHDGPLAWMPDSAALVVSANRHDNYEEAPQDTELYLVRVRDASMTQLTDRFGPDGKPAISPDGTKIAFTGFDDRFQGYQLSRLYVLDVPSGEVRLLAQDLDRSVDDPVWSEDGEQVWFHYDDLGKRTLARVSVGNGAVSAVENSVGGATLGRPYTSGSFSLSRENRYAFTHGGSGLPADVAVDGGAVLTSLNEDLFSQRVMAEIEPIRFRSSFDDREISGWVAKPPGFDPARKYPLILEIHGGPFAAYGPQFSMEVQLYAAAGYVVLYLNPRGSSSYGEEFGNLIHRAYPGNDYDDLMSGVDAILERGYVDAARLYVTGGSGGGVLTAWIVGKTDRFRAAVVAKPVINWISFALTADHYLFFWRYWFPGLPWEHVDHYWERSPLSLVGNVTTPTMLLTGESDHRTPISESEQYYQALRLKGVESAFVRMPGASHGIAARPSHLISKVLHILAWFEQYGQ